jgi:hypothetical protein
MIVLIMEFVEMENVLVMKVLKWKIVLDKVLRLCANLDTLIQTFALIMVFASILFI